MEWSILINEIFQVCLIPLLGVLTTYLVKYIQVKAEEIQLKNKEREDFEHSEKLNKYIAMLADTITQCVIATNQTYVESLKKEGKFDLEAQQIAFQKTLLAVQATLTAEAKQYLIEFYGDLDIYITSAIEAAVNSNK